MYRVGRGEGGRTPGKDRAGGLVDWRCGVMWCGVRGFGTKADRGEEDNEITGPGVTGRVPNERRKSGCPATPLTLGPKTPGYCDLQITTKEIGTIIKHLDRVTGMGKGFS